jgi:hypothetical protein
MTSVRLPDVPGKAPGVVAVRTDSVSGRTRYTLQCERCFELETPDHLVLMKTHFHTRGDDRRRLCPTCRRELFPDCACDGCKTDRGGSMY